MEVRVSFQSGLVALGFLIASLGGPRWQTVIAAEPHPVTIRDILQHRGAFSNNPVAVSGVVSLQARPGTFFMQDGSDAILVLLASPQEVQPGDQVTVDGLLSHEGFSPYLVRASARVLGHTNAPSPSRIKPSEASTGRYDCQLVDIDGELLLPPERYGDTWTLLLRGGDHFFRADMVRIDSSPVRAHLLPGSIIRIVGVCSVGGGTGAKKIYRLLVSQPQSISIVQPAPWLNVQTALRLLGFSSLFALAGVAWVVTLRRRVKQQTALIENQARDHAAGLERTVQERTAGMKRAVEDMQVFSYGVSHDLRASLRAISGLCDILVEDHGPTLQPEAASYVQRIRQSARKLSQLTKTSSFTGGSPVVRSS